MRNRRHRTSATGEFVVSATEAAKNFGGLVDRVREEQAVYVVERGGTPVAQIGPVGRAAPFTLAQLRALALQLVRPGNAYLSHVERAASRHSRPRPRRNPWER